MHAVNVIHPFHLSKMIHAKHSLPPSLTHRKVSRGVFPHWIPLLLHPHLLPKVRTHRLMTCIEALVGIEETDSHDGWMDG